ncbi:protein EMBRYONIC FLOWER 1-like isoform X1 [Hibiscus syriacus]|nr:protein EMBRYONIC FLOWER 1-like isoform X1 [Hibiscus syriacus]
MESTVVVVETQSCSSNLVPKSGESPINIDSISIDLINANDDIGARKCEHFSIRGYASEMRHKNWTKCWPFALDGVQSISEEQDCKLPPLLVPKFRWWCCQSCLHEIGSDGNVNEERTFANNGSKLKTFGSCPHLSSSNGGATIQLSDLQQSVKINVVSGKSDVSARVNVNSSDKSEKAAKVANIPIIGQTDLLENNISKETHISKFAGIDVISSLMKRTFHIGNKVAPLQLDKPSIKDNEIAGYTIPESNPSCTVNDATETHQAENHASTFVQQMEFVKTRGPFGVVNMVNGVSTAEYPSLELDDCDYASSESAEILLGSSSGRRKTRKVRLLTELLGKKEDEKNDLSSSEDSPSTAIPDASMAIDSVSAPHDQVSFQGNVASNLSLSRKRKLPQDETRRLGEMSSPNSGNKNLWTFNRGAETTDEIPIPDSDCTVNGSVSQTGAKSHLVSLKVYKSPTAGKMKNKKTQNFDECLSVVLSREKLQKQKQKKAGDTTKSNAIDIVQYKSNDASKDSELDPFSESAKKAEKNSNLLKKRSKMHQDLDGPAFPIPWNNGLLRECPTSRKDVEIQQTGSVSVAQDASAERRMQFSLNNFLPAKTYDGKYISPIRDGLPPLLPWQGHVHTEYEIGRKDLKMNSVGNSGFPFKSELEAYLWKRMHVDLNSNQTTQRIPFLNEKQEHYSCADVGSCSLVQQMDFRGKSNNGKSVELQDYSAIASKNYDQRAERASGQGASDDIPMEIVELMAKNQYERCLPDREIDKQPLETTNNTRSHQIRVDLNKVYGNEEMSLLHETTQKPKPRAKNRKIGKIERDDMHKSVDIFSHLDWNQYNMSQLEQSFSTASFKSSLCREKPLNGFQISAANSSRQNSAQNWQCIGNMVGQRSPQASVQALEVCNSCHSAPQQNKEAANLWPSTVPNNMPYLFGIPQRCRDQVANVDVLSHCHRNLQKGNASGNDDRNFLNQASSFEKHARKFDSEVLRTHADYPFACKHNGMGSIDLYSNETIPAMHLLSLMDAGLQSGAPVDVDGNQGYVKKTSSHGHHHSKVFSSLPSRGDRTNSMKHATYDCYGKSHLPESLCECTFATPAASPTSFLHDKSFKKASYFTAQLSLKSREKEKKFSDSQRQNKNCRSQKTASSNSGINTCGTCTFHSMPKMVLGTSDFMMFRTQLQALVSANKQNQDARTMSGTLFHPKSGSENEMCSINRNPADFSAPEAGNIYMIGGEDLKFGRGTPSSGMVKLTGDKRQKKLTVRKERSRS